MCLDFHGNMLRKYRGPPRSFRNILLSVSCIVCKRRNYVNYSYQFYFCCVSLRMRLWTEIFSVEKHHIFEVTWQSRRHPAWQPRKSNIYSMMDFWKLLRQCRNAINGLYEEQRSICLPSRFPDPHQMAHGPAYSFI